MKVGNDNELTIVNNAHSWEFSAVSSDGRCMVGEFSSASADIDKTILEWQAKNNGWVLNRMSYLGIRYNTRYLTESLVPGWTKTKVVSSLDELQAHRQNYV